MGLTIRGDLTDERAVRVGFVGCGSHSFRNVYPALKFAPVELAAVCDLNLDKACAYAKHFGAEAAYDSVADMLGHEELEAVFVVTSYDERGRPRYPDIACQCLAAGLHVWIEKPPAASVAEIERMQQAARQAGRHVMVGMKKMFFPANEKAKALIDAPEFGGVGLASFQYPQHVPTVEHLRAYLAGQDAGGGVVNFLDHLCHPMSLMVYLLGAPRTLFYQVSPSKAAVATFTFESGTVASLALNAGGVRTPIYERTQLLSANGGQIVTVENNLRVTLHREPKLGYGTSPSYYAGEPDGPSLVWEPEFSLGQLYNKGLFLLGYWGEVDEFARCILENRPPAKGTLEQARQVTAVFEAFAQGPGKLIEL